MSRSSFVTKVKAASGNRNGKTTVRWELDMDIEPWGISSFWAYVPDQTVVITWTDRDHNDDEFETEEEIILKDAGVCFRVLEDVVIPTELEHTSKGWRLNF